MTHLQFLSTTFVQAKNKGEKRRKKRKKENDLGIKLMCCKLLKQPAWSLSKSTGQSSENLQVQNLRTLPCAVYEKINILFRITDSCPVKVILIELSKFAINFFFFPCWKRQNIFGSLNHCLPQVRANSEETQKWAAVCILSAIDYIIMPYIYPATVVQQGRPKLGGNNPGLQYSKSLQTRQQQNVL